VIGNDGAREGDRETEDQAAKRKLGEQGDPTKPTKPAVADPDKLQISREDDPGHPA
jgi:hypothetical protein